MSEEVICCENCKWWKCKDKQCEQFPALYPVNGEDTNWCWCGKFWRTK